jgi:hypothetical protein
MNSTIIQTRPESHTVAMAKAGDPSAVNQLIHAYWPEAYQLALRILRRMRMLRRWLKTPCGLPCAIFQHSARMRAFEPGSTVSFGTTASWNCDASVAGH